MNLADEGKKYPWKRGSLGCPLFAAILYRSESIAHHLISVSKPRKAELKGLLLRVPCFVRGLWLMLPEETPSETELQRVYARLATVLNIVRPERWAT